MKRWLDLSADEIATKSAANRKARTVSLSFAEQTVMRKDLANSVRKAKLPKISIPTEHEEQAALIKWWDHYAKIRGLEPRLLFAIPNGSMLAGDERLRSIQARRLKDEGVRVGMSDLMLAIPNRIFHGLFIEMKRADWMPPKSGKSYEHMLRQSSMAVAFRTYGYDAGFARGFDAARKMIEEYLP